MPENARSSTGVDLDTVVRATVTDHDIAHKQACKDYLDALHRLVQRAGGELIHFEADGATLTMEGACEAVINAGIALREAGRGR